MKRRSFLTSLLGAAVTAVTVDLGMVAKLAVEEEPLWGTFQWWAPPEKVLGVDPGGGDFTSLVVIEIDEDTVTVERVEFQ